jgi:hypothetical protein
VIQRDAAAHRGGRGERGGGVTAEAGARASPSPRVWACRKWFIAAYLPLGGRQVHIQCVGQGLRNHSSSEGLGEGIGTIRYRREKMEVGALLFVGMFLLAGLHAGGVF